MRDFFFQTVMFLTGTIIGIIVPLLPKKGQKLAAGILAILLIVISLLWAGYEIGIKTCGPKVASLQTPKQTSLPLKDTETSTETHTSPTSYLFVHKEAILSGQQIFTVTLSDGEIITGQSSEVIAHYSSSKQLYVGCIAFLIVGPGEFAFQVSDGWWAQYKHVNSTDAEALLQEQVELLKGINCPHEPEIVRIP